jgi:hypothetical protein
LPALLTEPFLCLLDFSQFVTIEKKDEGPLRTTLHENETTLFENRPTTSGLDPIIVDHPKPPFLRQREASNFAAGDSVVGV